MCRISLAVEGNQLSHQSMATNWSEAGQAEQASPDPETLELELGRLQRAARDAQLPIAIVFEGWEASGKGTIISSLALAMDARGYRVVSIRPAQEQAPLFPPLHRFSVALPEAGRITIFDRSWYADLWDRRSHNRATGAELRAELAELHDFERMLLRSGTLVLKFFLQIDRQEQKKRFRKLRSSHSTRWRIDTQDSHQNEHFTRWQRAAAETLFATAPVDIPGFVVTDAQQRKVVKQTVFAALCQAIAGRLKTAGLAAGVPAGSDPTSPVADAARSIVRITDEPSPLGLVDLSQRLTREQYDAELPELQARLHNLEHRIYKKRIPVVISCEGWDAAGKGGAIRRLMAGLDPRGYDVHPISAPTSIERQHHYLWRFWTRVPKGGHIAVFDRSWYGRVLVERVEGFCSEADWKRAFEEIAAFERSLVRFGTVLVKFWFHIDQETQIARFRDREANPDKQWKITEEDWRNRNRWADYEAAVADMLVLNHSKDCPYTVVPANDKLFARVFTLRTVVAAIERRLGDEERPKRIRREEDS